MIWVVSISVVVLLAVVLFAWMIWVNGGRNVDRNRLPDIVRDLLIKSEDGGFRRFNVCNSHIWFSIERVSGSENSAQLALRVPRSDWTLAVLDQLQDVFNSHSFKWQNQRGNPSLLAKVLIPVDDFWAKPSGARGAHAVHLFLDVLEVPGNARFNVEIGGYPSDRWKKKGATELWQ